ncbi:MAG: 16S rRNA (guanine(966)-N(2))-methyltransferase RsmD [Bradymonadales bacterium]|jgi:16S rRNA (guanine966-N2)-methyltransferase
MPSIIAGKRRGAKLLAPANDGVRPTPARVREAIFSSLHALLGDWSDEIVLDAFAGSGALGLEAWSRGAKYVQFIEENTAHYKILQKNIEKLEATVQCRAKLATFPECLAKNSQRYSLVFLDPPYHSELLKRSLHALVQYQVLANKAILSLEYDEKQDIDVETSLYSTIRLKKYGRVVSHFLQYNGG